MVDDPPRCAAQPKRINAEEEHEVRFWSERWGISTHELISAITYAGPLADDVARALGKPV